MFMFLRYSDEPNPRIPKREESSPHCTQVQMQHKAETLQQAEMNPYLARVFQQKPWAAGAMSQRLYLS